MFTSHFHIVYFIVTYEYHTIENDYFLVNEIYECMQDWNRETTMTIDEVKYKEIY